MPPLPGALPTRCSGFFCQATSTGGGAHHLTLLGRAVPPILLLLEGKGKGSQPTIQWRFVGCDPLLMPGFSVLRAGYLVVGFLAGGFIIAALLMTIGIMENAGERLRGVVRAGCGKYPRCEGRFSGASGDGLGGCIS